MKAYKHFIPAFLCLAVMQQAYAIGDTLSSVTSKAGDAVLSVKDKVTATSTAADIDRDVDQVYAKLIKSTPSAEKLSKTAKAILIFPRIIKAGMGVGGHRGSGALRQNGKTSGYYMTIAGSYGLQIGAQTFGYAMFFMDDKSLKYLFDHNDGWEVGVGPSVVFVDTGLASTLNNTTITESVYVLTFNQRGLMAGAGIQGSKITRIHPPGKSE